MSKTKAFFIFILATVLISIGYSSVSARLPSIPGPPSKEELERLRELGRENERIYGTGTTTPIPSISTPTTVPTIVQLKEASIEAEIQVKDVNTKSTGEAQPTIEDTIPEKSAPVLQRMMIKVRDFFQGLFG